MKTPTQDGAIANFKRIICNLTKKELLFILVMFLAEIGCNFSLDLPGALQNALINNYNLTSSQFALFYSLYHIPTILNNVIGGYLIDRVLGIKLSTLLYCIAGLIGSTLFPFGGAYNMFWMMLMGRLLFGLGNEMTTGVCVNYCMFSWYRNSVVNLMSSIYAGGALLGSLAVYQIAPRLLGYFRKSITERHALNIVVSLISASFIITAALSMTMTFLKPKKESDSSEAEPEPVEVIQPKFRDILEFPLVFWIVCTINFVRAMAEVLNQFSQGLLTSSFFGLTVREASDVITVMVLVNVILSLPISFFVDITGRNTRYILVALIVAIMGHILLILGVNPYAGLAVQGLSSSLYNAAILPMFAYPLEKHLIGSCYGVMSTMQGVSNTIAPIAVGKLVDAYGYQALLYFCITASAFCLACIILVYILDKRSTGVLNMTPKQRIDYEQMKENKRLSMARASTSTVLPPICEDKVEPTSYDFSSITILTNNEIG